MIINFNEIEETVIPNFKGGEKSIVSHMFVDKNNKIMCGCLEPGASIGLHTHDTSSEIIYILNGEYESVSEGLCHYCPKGHSHSLINDSKSDLVFFAVVPEQ